MAKQNRRRTGPATRRPPVEPDRAVAGVRIIGGRHRGRRLHYSGDLRTRPMKDRLREAVFNLVGPGIRGAHAIDLFAGTGALALEAISRGADRATLIEQHNPTANLIRQNIAELGVTEQAEVVVGNVFIWWKRNAAGQLVDLPRDKPWTLFCSPPYDFYVERVADMLELIAGLIEAAPAGSIFVVEADARFDFQQLPDPPAWNVRTYPPAVVGIFRKV
jgi:16S rRNA (guanine966-N2)-methyltransferase